MDIATSQSDKLAKDQTTLHDQSFIFGEANHGKRKLDSASDEESIEERVTTHIEYLTGHLSQLIDQRKQLEKEVSSEKEQLKHTFTELYGPEITKTQQHRELASFKENMEKMKEQLAKTAAEIKELNEKLFEEKKKAVEGQTMKGQKTVEMLSKYISCVGKVSREAFDAFELDLGGSN